MIEPTIAVVGPWPRPWGGISTHIYRLLPRLREKGFSVAVYDDTGTHSGENVFPLRGSWTNRFVLTAREKIIHYHSHSWGIRMRLSLMTARGKKVVFTIHSLRNMPRDSTRKRPEFGHMLRKARFIAVNEEIAERLSGIGARNVEVIGPYISPSDYGKSHPEIRAFALTHRPLLCLSALLFRTWGNGDLYGMFSALDALALLRKDLPRAGMVVYLSQIGEESLFGFFIERTRALGLERDIMLRLDAEEPFHTCLPLAQVFLRPTLSDSFGLSLAEAFELGVPVVASDAVPRPGKVFLFKTGDPADMVRAIKEALSSKPEKINLDEFPALADFYAQLF